MCWAACGFELGKRYCILLWNSDGEWVRPALLIVWVVVGNFVVCVDLVFMRVIVWGFSVVVGLHGMSSIWWWLFRQLFPMKCGLGFRK